MEVEFVGAVGVLGLALLGVGILGRTGRLARNGLVGLRTPSLTASDEAWRMGHRVAGGWLMALGAASLLVATTAVVADQYGVLPSWVQSPVAVDAVMVVQLLAACCIAIHAGRVVRRNPPNGGRVEDTPNDHALKPDADSHDT